MYHINPRQTRKIFIQTIRVFQMLLFLQAQKEEVCDAHVQVTRVSHVTAQTYITDIYTQTFTDTLHATRAFLHTSIKYAIGKCAKNIALIPIYKYHRLLNISLNINKIDYL